MKNSGYPFFLFLILALSQPSVARAQQDSSRQNPGYIHLGGHLALPLGNMIGEYKLLLGSAIQIDFPVKQRVVFLTVNAAYQELIRENKASSSLKNPKILPLKVGLKFFPVEQIYLQADLGASFVLNKTHASFDRTAVLVFSNELGYRVAIPGGNVAEAGLVFHRNAAFIADGSSHSFFGIKLSFGFAY